MRIDLCFNKIFHSKEDALRYLADLKRIKKKFLRDNTLQVNNYHTGIYYPTRDYTFKVYHKGSEFRNNDRKEIKRYVTREEMETIQDFSDRVLRYELEFRTRYLDSIFKKYLFRKDSKDWQRARKLYQSVTSTGYAKINGKKLHLLSFPKRERQLYEYGKFYLNKVFGFYLECDSAFHLDSPIWNSEIKTGEFSFDRDLRFGGKLFSKLVDVFKIFYNEFSVSYTNDLAKILATIEFDTKDKEERNRRIANALAVQAGEMPSFAEKISFQKVQLFFELLKTKSFSEIKDSGLFPERTFYRYKKFFSCFGMKDYSTSIVVPHSEMDFTDYFDQVEKTFSRMDFVKLFYRPF